MAVALGLLALVGWLWLDPPDLLRVGTGYTAKIVCSNAFVADRPAAEVLSVDVQAPGHPLLRRVSVEVDRDNATASAVIFGFFARSTARVTGGAGCAVGPDNETGRGVTPAAGRRPDEASLSLPWPAGNRVDVDNLPGLSSVLADSAIVGPGLRAALVVKDGRIIAERYEDGFTPEVPLLGWSMTKSVTAALVGSRILSGELSLETNALFEDWADDERSDITLSHLLGMSSGLAWDESYGDVTDVTRMLFLEPDMATFARGMPLEASPGTRFRYSSGTSVLLSRIWQDTFDDEGQAIRWPTEALFGPLGMSSAVLELDAQGTFVGSSYLYATPGDWARFGQLLLQEGEWRGQALLPDGFVSWMREPVPQSNGRYGKGHVWLTGPSDGDPPGRHADEGFELPADTFWMLGHDGQSIAIVPSEALVVVRLGLTPSRVGYKPQRLLEAVVRSLAEPPRE